MRGAAQSFAALNHDILIWRHLLVSHQCARLKEHRLLAHARQQANLEKTRDLCQYSEIFYNSFVSVFSCLLQMYFCPIAAWTLLRLAIDLRARGIDVWIDQWALQVGEEFWPHIERAVCSAQKLLVLVSSSSVASGWVEKEWTQKGVGKGLVIPVLCERCDMPDGIASQDAVDISGGSYWAGLAQLIDIIRPNNSV